jgi:hypothetical protein
MKSGIVQIAVFCVEMMIILIPESCLFAEVAVIVKQPQNMCVQTDERSQMIYEI